MTDVRDVVLPDRCESCGRFVGYYPVGFYDDRYCGPCYDDTRDPVPPAYFMPGEDGYARAMARYQERGL
jgi:hypothetical protein